MTILKDEDLEFARAHISKFYDSDFFPKPIEFEALWMHWDEVLQELKSKNISKMQLSSPGSLAAPKPSGSFRVVHQLDPMDALVYTALVANVAGAVEAARMPVNSKIACSYRIAKVDGSFFGAGTGWDVFTNRTEELATAFKHVLVVDISDFYNQIYLHRVNNAIELCDKQLKGVADDIEGFLTSLYVKTSQGIPVGPAASVVIAEAVLIDVDQFLENSGFPHTRYVDDFRIFGNDEDELRKLLEQLTLYLYNAHRLSLAPEKTRVLESAEFLDQKIHNKTAEERAEIFAKLEVFNPYSEEFEEVEIAPDDFSQTEAIQEKLEEVLGAMLDSEVLDLGIARAVIRTAKRAQVDAIAVPLLEELCFVAPVINDVCIYLDQVVDAAEHVALLEACIEFPCMRLDLVRYWFTWYLARHISEFKSPKIRQFVYQGGWLEHVAVAAIAEKNVAWVRERKNNVFDLSPKARRAVVHAGLVLPADEREAWLKNVISNTVAKLDVWMCKWVIARGKQLDAAAP